jgi:hypothetical protein
MSKTKERTGGGPGEKEDLMVDGSGASKMSHTLEAREKAKSEWESHQLSGCDANTLCKDDAIGYSYTTAGVVQCKEGLEICQRMHRLFKFDPMTDELKPLTNVEFEAILKELVEDYTKTFNNMNEFHRTSHTFLQWMNSFGGYLSF